MVYIDKCTKKREQKNPLSSKGYKEKSSSGPTEEQATIKPARNGSDYFPKYLYL